MADHKPKDATIPVLCAGIDAMLDTLRQKYVNSRSSLGSSVVDIAERFSIWADNIGAKQELGSHMSLQYRVRDAPKLASLFLGRLEDLREDLADRELQTFNCLELSKLMIPLTPIISSHGRLG